MVRTPIIVILILFLIAFEVNADVEPTILYYGTVTTKQATHIRGYFHCYSFYLMCSVTDTIFYYMDGSSEMHVKLKPDSVSNLFAVEPFQYHIGNHILRQLKNTENAECISGSCYYWRNGLPS